MSYRDDLDALAARHDALDVELAEKTRELDQIARQLEDAKERAKLPVLPNLRIATPCRADWNEMAGDERVRHCASCDKDVFNLSSLTREQAEALILAKAGNLCARYYQRQDGTILLADCEVGIAQKRKRRVIAAGAALLLGGGAAAWLLRPREPQYTMGSVGSLDGLDKETMATRVLANELEPPPPPEPLQPVEPARVDPEISVTMGAVAITHEVVAPEPTTVEIEK